MFERKRRRAQGAVPAPGRRPEPLEMTPREAADCGAWREDCVRLEDVLAADEEPEEGSRGKT